MNFVPSKAERFFKAAQTALAQGKLAEATENADAGLAADSRHPSLGLIRAIVDHRLGRTSLAVDRLRRILAESPPNAVEITIMLAEVLSRGGRRVEAAALLASREDWKSDDRSAVFEARALALTDKSSAIARLTDCASSTKSLSLKRIAGFEAVRMLDAEARFQDAFDLATAVHRETTPNFDILGVEADTSEQLRMLSRSASNRRTTAPECRTTAMVVGLPRSGTTLVEQMLDRHPLITGIGEYEGVSDLGEALLGRGLWPARLRELATTDATALQAEYLAGAQARKREGATHTFDKTLRAWRLLPAVAAVLPGVSLIHIERDARDCAISMYLSNFHPQSFGFTASLAMIKRVMLAERKLVEPSIGAFALRGLRLRYEALVANPQTEIERVLAHIGVEFDTRVLSPEANERTVLTLSHEQVRRKINNSSIGRWKNYAFAFDASWDALDAV
ncbi:MAG: hypothetical protein EXS10_01355 [Phycisphaerales bacterium]|nr:hypothetical protein [Phycisphaerales bacterium]